MKNKKNNYRIIEEDRLVYLLELEQLVNRLGFGFSPSKYRAVKQSIRSLGYVQKELEKHEILSDVIEEVLDAENVFEVSDEEKEDSLYIEEFDSCDCGCCSDDYDDGYDDEDEVEGTYVIFYLEDEDEDDDDETDSETAFHLEYDTHWVDEFDDFYSDSFKNLILKEMEESINSKCSTSTEKEEEQKNIPDNAIISLELYQIFIDYFKKLFE